MNAVARGGRAEKVGELRRAERGAGHLAWTKAFGKTWWPVMSLAQIRYFVAVAEEGNVGRASRRLRVAQPPLSRHIRSLEDELGAQLFRRTPRGMALLPAGELFLAHARRILDAVDDAERALLHLRPSPHPPP